MAHQTRTAPPTATRRRHLLAAWACATVLATGLLLVNAGPAAAGAGFSVSPLMFDLQVNPGSSTTKQITVLNTMGTGSTFTVSKEDLGGNKSDPSANPVLLGGEVASSISGYDWLNPSTSSFSLDSGESRTFNVTVSAPSGATGGHYAAVTIASSGQRISDSLTAQSRVAVLFFMNAGNTPPPEIVIEDVTVTKDGETIIDYINKGKKAASPTATVTYVDPITGKTVAVGTTTCGTALPGAIARCIVHELDRKGDALLPSVGSVVIANEGRKAKADLPIEWSGSWSSALLPLTGLFLLVIYFLRLRRRKDDDEDQDVGALPA